MVLVAFVVVAFTAVKFWRVVEPVKERLPKLPCPVVVMLSAPVSIEPKPLVMEPELRAETEVRLERVVMEATLVVADKTAMALSSALVFVK